MRFDSLPWFIFPPQLSDKQLQELLLLLKTLTRVIEQHYAEQRLCHENPQTALDFGDEDDLPF